MKLAEGEEAEKAKALANAITEDDVLISEAKKIAEPINGVEFRS